MPCSDCTDEALCDRKGLCQDFARKQLASVMAINEAGNQVRAEARALGGARGLGELLAAVEAYADARCVADGVMASDAPQRSEGRSE